MNDDFLVAKKSTSGDFFDDQGRVTAYVYVHVALPFGPGYIDLPYGLGESHWKDSKGFFLIGSPEDNRLLTL